MAKPQLGKIHVYTGEGKGKTTAALGLALRAVGRGYKVIMIQFLKKQTTGEYLAQSKLKPYLAIYQFGRQEFYHSKDGPNPEDVKLAQTGLEFAKKTLAEEKPNLLILDEINVALYFNLLKLTEVNKILDQAVKQGTEVVLTGQKAKPEIIKIADLVTEMKKVKHYFDKGIEAREGVEF